MIQQDMQAHGLSVGSFHWDATRQEDSESTSSRMPPSILLPSRHGEPLRLDIECPPHPRGTGENWPAESQIVAGGGVGRFPLALAWTARRLSPEVQWHWKSPVYEEMNCRPIDAIAEGISQLAVRTCPIDPVAVVVPNDFRQEEQQKVLDACRRHNLDTSLIWLPVAAALRWLELENGNIPGWEFTNRRNPRLLIVHADWGQITTTMLDLVPWPDSNPSRWVPARNRPAKSDVVPGFGWALLFREGDNRPSELAKSWQKLFAAPVERGKALPAEPFNAEAASEVLKSLQGWPIDQGNPDQIRRRIDSIVHREMDRLVGVVIVGDCASSIDLSNLNEQKDSKCFIRIYTEKESDAYLAKGAEIFRRTQLKDEVAYLDSLPELELFLEQRGEYCWHPLLKSSSQYVAGGKPWEMEEPIDVSIRRGEEDVRLVVWHEEYEGVREVVASLNRPAEQRRPGKLYVTATPAQGNAILRVDLEGDAEHYDSITANWQRMRLKQDDDGKPMTRQAFLDSQPRAYPELMPRRGSLGKWQNVCSSIRQRSGESITAERIEQENAYWISGIKDLVLEKDQSEYGVDRTAVGSDHSVSTNQNELKTLTAACLDYWRTNRQPKRRNRRLEDAIRILGYISASDREFEHWLIASLEFSMIDKTVLVHACGHCLREPANLSRFFLSVFGLIPSAINVSSNSLKAVSQALRYRTNATEELSDEHAYRMINKCLDVFREDMIRRDGRTFQFRWSCLIVGFLLRRRIYSSDFLPPDGSDALRAKELFLEAIQRHLKGKLFPIGGSVNTPAAMQQLIDYIDKRGVGVLALGFDGQ